jgi:hypothetical protein
VFSTEAPAAEQDFVCVFVCVCARARARVCVFQRKVRCERRESVFFPPLIHPLYPPPWEGDTGLLVDNTFYVQRTHSIWRVCVWIQDYQMEEDGGGWRRRGGDERMLMPLDASGGPRGRP